MPHRKTAFAAIALLACIGFFGVAYGARAQDTGPGSPDYTGPNLEIPVPGLEFSGIIRENEYITIPWLGQYVGGVYTFLISIVGMFAATVIVIGGFQYVTAAGDKGKIGAAKKRMMNAFMGMLLVFGSYTLLYAINPALTRFEGLSISLVKGDPLMEAMMTTTEPTSVPPTNSTTVMSTTTEGPFSGKIYKKADGCPLALTDTSMKGIPDFMQKIREGMGTIVDAKTPQDVAVQIGNIASVCDQHLGNCGKSVGTFYALAGLLNSPTCNKNSTNNKDCNEWPDYVVHNNPDTKLVWWARCDNNQANKMPDAVACPYTGPWKKVPGKTACGTDCLCTRSDCATGQFAAWSKVTKDLMEKAKTEPKMAGWPDSWTKDLRRGDWVIGYNGNPDKTGGHSTMFVGWSDKDHIITLNGSAESGIHYATLCVTSNCPTDASARWNMLFPITRILRWK